MTKQELLKQADSNYQRGNRELAKKYLSDLLAAYPNEEAAWLLLAKVVEEKERKIECYKRALKINPANNETRIALTRIDSSSPTLPLNGRLSITPAQSPKPYKNTLRAILATVVVLFIFGTTSLVVARNSPDSNNNSENLLLKMWPNPYTINATIQFSTNGGNTMIQQINSLGQVVKVLANGDYAEGTHNIDIYSDGLPTGAYFLRLQNKSLQKVLTVMKVN